MSRRRPEPAGEDGEVCQEAQIALDDVENAGSAALHYAMELRDAFMDHLRRPVVRGGVGLAVLFYGGHFKRTAVVCSSLKGYQLVMLQAQFEEVGREYRRARGQPVDAADEAAAGGFVMVTPGRLPDPRPLFQSIQRMQSSVIAQVAAALNENTSRLLLGLELGRRAAEAAGERLETLLLGPATEVTGGEERRVVTRMAIDAACTATGVAVAWSLRGWAALWTTCGLGAQLIMEAVDVVAAAGGGDGRGLPVELRALCGASLTGIGFVYQAWYGGAPPLPAPFWLLAGPLRVLELGLTSVS